MKNSERDSKIHTYINDQKFFQISQCTAESYDCVASIKVKDSECFQQCSGILFTSYDKKSVEDRLDAGIMKLVEYFLRINKESGIGIFTNMDKEFQG